MGSKIFRSWAVDLDPQSRYAPRFLGRYGAYPYRPDPRYDGCITLLFARREDARHYVKVMKESENFVAWPRATVRRVEVTVKIIDR